MEEDKKEISDVIDTNLDDIQDTAIDIKKESTELNPDVLDILPSVDLEN